MIRTWATGSAHDDAPLDWLFDLRHSEDVAHMTKVIEAVTLDEDPSVGQWQTALLVAECVAHVQSGPCDVHEDAHAWLQAVRPSLTQEDVDRTLELVRRARTNSSLQRWWHQTKPEELPVWQRSVSYLAERIKDGADVRPAGN